VYLVFRKVFKYENSRIWYFISIPIFQYLFQHCSSFRAVRTPF